jgi:hypothetical protein
LVIQTNRTGGRSNEALGEGMNLRGAGGAGQLGDGLAGDAVSLAESDDLLAVNLH